MTNVMKAQKIEEAELRTWSLREWRKWRVEKKINGFRMTRVNGRWLSKQGKRFFNVKSITDPLTKNSLFKRYIIDGELAGASWNQTMTLFRSSVKDVSDLLKDGRFYLFDLIDPERPDEAWEDRYDRLCNLVAAEIGEFHPHIHVIRSEIVKSFKHFQVFHQSHLNHGCDGSVLKFTKGPYEFKRSRYWLKVKPVRDMDCQIVGFNEGKGKYVGMLGSLQVVVPMGENKWSKQITNVSGMTDAHREYIWKHKKKLLHSIVEVYYREISKNNRLVEGRVNRIRFDRGKACGGVIR